MTAAEAANGMTRMRVIRKLSTDCLVGEEDGTHGVGQDLRSGHSRSKLDLTKGAGFG